MARQRRTGKSVEVTVIESVAALYIRSSSDMKRRQGHVSAEPPVAIQHAMGLVPDDVDDIRDQGADRGPQRAREPPAVVEYSRTQPCSGPVRVCRRTVTCRHRRRPP